MKYEGKRPRVHDRDIPVYTFSVGKQELEILAKILQKQYANCPNITETQTYKSRLKNLSREFGKLYLEESLGKTVSKRFPHESIKRNLSTAKGSE